MPAGISRNESEQTPETRCVCPSLMPPGINLCPSLMPPGINLDLCPPAQNTTQPNDPWQCAAYARRLCRPALNVLYGGRHTVKARSPFTNRATRSDIIWSKNMATGIRYVYGGRHSKAPHPRPLCSPSMVLVYAARHRHILCRSPLSSGIKSHSMPAVYGGRHRIVSGGRHQWRPP